MMNFRSDNEAGAQPDHRRRGLRLASGSPASFGEDEWTRRVERRFRVWRRRTPLARQRIRRLRVHHQAVDFRHLKAQVRELAGAAHCNPRWCLEWPLYLRANRRIIPKQDPEGGRDGLSTPLAIERLVTGL